jgi:hypothetical protein
MQSALEKHVEFFEEVVSSLHEVVISLHHWMLAIGSLLERAEALAALGVCTCIQVNTQDFLRFFYIRIFIWPISPYSPKVQPTAPYAMLALDRTASR